MNDEVLNEIENVAPTITEAAKKLFAEQDAELRLQPPETDQGLGGPETTDQSQSATAVNNQNQNVESQPVEQRGPTRAELDERLKEKRRRGERITFADTFGGQSADLRNTLTVSYTHLTLPTTPNV